MDVLLLVGNRQFLTCTYFYLSFGVYRFKYRGRGNQLTAFGTDYETLDFRAEIAECAIFLMPAFIQTTFSKFYRPTWNRNRIPTEKKRRNNAVFSSSSRPFALTMTQFDG